MTSIGKGVSHDFEKRRKLWKKEAELEKSHQTIDEWTSTSMRAIALLVDNTQDSRCNTAMR